MTETTTFLLDSLRDQITQLETDRDEAVRQRVAAQHHMAEANTRANHIAERLHELQDKMFPPMRFSFEDVHERDIRLMSNRTVIHFDRKCLGFMVDDTELAKLPAATIAERWAEESAELFRQELYRKLVSHFANLQHRYF